ncbi:MAG: LysR substrate-binding domain-containing protein [Kiloniellales bacterium]
MSIKQIRAVRAIADHGSFAAAAKALNLAQSAISMQVTTFEESLGVQLFDRSHRPPQLTDAGRSVLDHARVILDEYDAMLDAVARGPTRSGMFRIGVIPTVLTTLLPSALIILRETAPRISVTVASDVSGDLMRAVDRGEVDAALIHEPDQLPEGFVWNEITRQEVMAIAPETAEEQDLPALLAAHPYIRFNRTARVAPLIEARLAKMGLDPLPIAELQSIEAIRLLVRLGFGVSILPSTGPAQPDEGLRRLSIGDPPLFRRIGLFMRKSLARRQVTQVVTAAFAKAAEPEGRDHSQSVG